MLSGRRKQAFGLASLTLAFTLAGCSIRQPRLPTQEDPNWVLPPHAVSLYPAAKTDCLPLRAYKNDPFRSGFSTEQKYLAEALDLITTDPLGAVDVKTAADSGLILCNDISRRETMVEKDGIKVTVETSYGARYRDWFGNYTPDDPIFAVNLPRDSKLTPQNILSVRHEFRHVTQVARKKKLVPEYNSSADPGAQITYFLWREGDAYASEASFAWHQKQEHGRPEFWDEVCKSPRRFRKVCDDINALARNPETVPTSDQVHVMAFLNWLDNKPETKSYIRDALVARLFKISAMQRSERDIVKDLSLLMDKPTQDINSDERRRLGYRLEYFIGFRNENPLTPTGMMGWSDILKIVRHDDSGRDWTDGLLPHKQRLASKMPEWLNANLNKLGLTPLQMRMISILKEDLKAIADLRPQSRILIQQTADRLGFKLPPLNSFADNRPGPEL